MELKFVAAIDSPGVDSRLRTVEGMDVVAHTIVAEDGIDAGVSDWETISDRRKQLYIVRWKDESIETC
jgi:hypothetical protein